MSPAPEAHPDDDLAAYALDALGPAEQRPVERHLARCPTCRRELADHYASVAQLIPDEPPPPELWQRIASATGPRLDLAPTSLVAAVPTRATTSRPRRPWTRAVAAAAAVVAGITIWATRDDGGVHRDVGQLALGSLHDPDADSATLETADGERAARVVATDTGAFVVFGDLAALPAGRAYQLWTLDGDQPVSVGLLGAGTADVVPVTLPRDTRQLAISEEAARGSPSPTSVVATGTMSSR